MASVGINLLWLVPERVGGSQEYTTRLLEAAGPQLAGAGIDAVIYCQPSLRDRCSHLDQWYEMVTPPLEVTAKPLRIAVENTWLATRSRRCQLIHHGGGTIPFVRMAPGIVTVHDTQPIDKPDNFSKLKGAWLQKMIPYSVSAARKIITPSHFTASRIADRYGISASKLAVIPQGFCGEKMGGGDPESATLEIARFGSFILYPAIAYPHKRHLDLLDLLAADGELNLVLTGANGPLDSQIAAEAITRGLHERLFQVGRVSAGDLMALYKRAICLVFPSEYEGFGNPVLEAMGFGCPVVAARIGAIREIAGDGASLFEVGDTGAAAKAVARIKSDDAHRRSLIEKGRKRAASFDYAESGARLVQTYVEAAEGSNG